MTGLIIDIGNGIFSGIVQLFAGCLLSLAVTYAAKSKLAAAQSRIPYSLIIILASSLLGTFLPLSIYGIIPLFVVAVASGFKAYAVIPAIISNALFNLLVPYTEASFAWVSAPGRILAANIASICAGLVLMKLASDDRCIIKRLTLEKLNFKPIRPVDIARFAAACINNLGPYLIIGVAANCIFQRYFLLKLMSGVYSSSIGASTAGFLLSYNVMHPVFIVATTIINSFTNLLQLSGLLAILKFRWVIAYFALYSVLAVLLALSVMLVA
jgi:hypothetical protein